MSFEWTGEVPLLFLLSLLSGENKGKEKATPGKSIPLAFSLKKKKKKNKKKKNKMKTKITTAPLTIFLSEIYFLANGRAFCRSAYPQIRVLSENLYKCSNSLERKQKF